MMSIFQALPDGRVPAIETLLRIASLIEAMPEHALSLEPTKVFLSASDFGTVVYQLCEKGGEPLPKIGEAPQYLMLGSVHFINAGTDDAEVVTEVNRLAAEASGFSWKRDHLRTG